MKLHIINSNSEGNCYLLTAENGQTLMIECGVDFRKIQHALDYDFRNVVGCLISHAHNDHCKCVEKVLRYTEVYSSMHTHALMNTLMHHNSKYVTHNKAFSVGNFRVIPFTIKHDCADPFGFLIQHPEMGICLFATDTYYLEHTFPNLNQVIIEANYASDILDSCNKVFLQNRVMQSHMSLETCKTTLQANDLTNVQNIVLIHLSNGNADSKRFKSEIEACTGKLVHIAKPNLTISFNKNPF